MVGHLIVVSIPVSRRPQSTESYDFSQICKAYMRSRKTSSIDLISKSWYCNNPMYHSVDCIIYISGDMSREED